MGASPSKQRGAAWQVLVDRQCPARSPQERRSASPLKRLAAPVTPPAPMRRKVQSSQGHEAECTLAVAAGDLSTALEVGCTSASEDNIAIKVRGVTMAAASLGFADGSTNDTAGMVCGTVAAPPPSKTDAQGLTADHVFTMARAVQVALHKQKCKISTEDLRRLVDRVEWLWRGVQQPLAIVAEGGGAHVALAAWLTLAADFEGVLEEEILQACAHVVVSNGKLHRARAMAMLQRSRAMAVMQVFHAAAPKGTV